MCWRHQLGSVQPCGAGVAPGLCIAVISMQGLPLSAKTLLQRRFAIWMEESETRQQLLRDSIPILCWVHLFVIQGLYLLLV